MNTFTRAALIILSQAEGPEAELSKLNIEGREQRSALGFMGWEDDGIKMG